MAAFLVSSCGITPKTETPIPTIAPAADERKSKTLIVMLPGRGDRAENFQQAGFLKGIDGKDFDVISVDAHFGYYKSRTLVPRLHEDVIVPAQQSGYESIWLLGVSMGGMGSLLYADQHPGIVDGLILLAPYLGDPGLASEVKNAGGLENWSAQSSTFMEHEVAIWNRLKTTRTGAQQLPVYLGYGLSDRFSENYDVLGGDTDALHIYTAVGGHNWDTWFGLWSRISADLNLE